MKGASAQGITRRVLLLKESLALNEIVQARYAASGLDNAAFAESINKLPDERSKFRFELAATHITTALEAADIPPNRARVGGFNKNVELVLRVQDLEAQMTLVMRKIGLPPYAKR